jgi:hypothetical protein
MRKSRQPHCGAANSFLRPANDREAAGAYPKFSLSKFAAHDRERGVAAAARALMASS